MNCTELYIIGNGFDIHHGVPSRYSQFKEFLHNVDPRLCETVSEYLIVDEYWSDLEAALARLDVDQVLDAALQFLQPYSADGWSDSYHHDYQFELDRIVSALSGRLKNRFCEWLSQLKIPSSEDLSNNKLALPKDGTYLNFNYTPTLEYVYGIPVSSILPIHGRSNQDESKIVLGHYWRPEERLDLNEVPNPEDMDTRIMEGNDLINDYFGKTFKSVDKIIEDNMPFFDGLAGIERVLVLGHSLSEVDLLYFKKIVESVPRDTDWIVSFYGEEELARHKETMSGFGVTQVQFCALMDI